MLSKTPPLRSLTTRFPLPKTLAARIDHSPSLILGTNVLARHRFLDGPPIIKCNLQCSLPNLGDGNGGNTLVVEVRYLMMHDRSEQAPSSVIEGDLAVCRVPARTEVLDVGVVQLLNINGSEMISRALTKVTEEFTV